MFHINDIIEKAKSRYETLLNITDTIEQKGYWNKTQSIHDNVEEHILSLYLQLVSKDFIINDEETAMINGVLGKNYSRGRLVLHQARVGEKDINSIPDYLISCIKMDLMEKTTYSYKVINCINSLGLLMIGADYDISEVECKFLSKYISGISDLVGKFGIAENNGDTKSSMDDTGKEEPNISICSDSSGKGMDSYTAVSGVLDELNNLIGLESVKKEVKALVDLIKVRKMREERGLPVVPMSFHLVFTGNPGTGKTTVARLISKIYYYLGLIKTDKVVEVDRAGLIAGYVGQTAAKVQEVINQALGGVLFIDEAYSLINENSSDDYGLEAVSTLLKGMEDHRDKLIVIAAGYEEEMARFINSNPGLKSRFSKQIHFDDYTPLQMLQILKKCAMIWDTRLVPMRKNMLSIIFIESKVRMLSGSEMQEE
ncbi:MAG TPA: AAA family ATPase [Acetivibrio sp.]|mgnify:CR=1 FL=1|nr:AAA family ATPase [Clostridium sp.]HOQ37532.1 AAA family ATPase [Acetivibrio sp.]HQA57859.1 AAA family ATPase [Acetivibrio sp.]